MSAKARVEEGRVEFENAIREKLVGRSIIDVNVIVPEGHGDYVAKVLLRLGDGTVSEMTMLCPHPELIKDT